MKQFYRAAFIVLVFGGLSFTAVDLIDSTRKDMLDLTDKMACPNIVKSGTNDWRRLAVCEAFLKRECEEMVKSPTAPERTIEVCRDIARAKEKR